MQKNWWYQTEWHSKMDKSMQVNGMGERTREAYLRSMRQLVEHYGKAPDHITEEELLDYFIHRQDVTGWSSATMRICYSGVKFFFQHVLKRDWHLLTIAQARRERRLPAVLSRKDVQGSAVAPLSVQQPTGVIRMSIIRKDKLQSPAYCEKSALFRHVLLLPKIAHSYPSRSSVGQSLPILAPVSGQYRYKLGNKALYSPACRWKKQRSDDSNAIASDTRLSSSSVNPKLFSIR